MRVTMGALSILSASIMQAETMRIIRASILGSVAVLPILILPSMVGALVDFAGFTEGEAGWVAAVGFTGSALGAIGAGLRIQHFDPRRLAIFGLLILAIFDGVSLLVNQLPVWLFLVFRFVSGFGGAVAYAAVMTTIAASNNQERGYGIFMVFQFGISAVLLYTLPIALTEIGVLGMFAAMAIAAALSLLLRNSVIHRPPNVEDAAIEIHMLIKPAAILAMVGIGFYETANFIWYTYSDRIGVSIGLDVVRIGEILGFSAMLGIPAALLVVWMGDRFGQIGPLIFAVLLAMGAELWLLFPTGISTYVVSMAVLSFAWAVGLPYFYAVEARLDPGGSVVVVGGFFTNAGSVAGPAIAATLVVPDGYDQVLLAGLGAYLIVICLMMLSVRIAVRA
jgi:MFS family permease